MTNEFTAVETAELPGRAPKVFDQGMADSLLAITSLGKAAQSNAVLDSEDAARKAATIAKRMLNHVAPAGKVAKARVFQVAKGWGYAITLADAKVAASDGEADAEAES